jgi:hypothetical protein
MNSLEWGVYMPSACLFLRDPAMPVYFSENLKLKHARKKETEREKYDYNYPVDDRKTKLLHALYCD